MINVALPKGRLGEKVYKLLAKCGYACSELESENRKLVFTNEDAGVSYFWVKPSDVAIYVELGAADVGVVGKDTLVESGAEVYELMDLNIGKCRMCVAAKNGYIHAQFHMGYMYGKGQGVSKNGAEAIRWFMKVAENKNDEAKLKAQAQFNIALTYDLGIGIQSNKYEAVKWYKKASDQGHVEAEYNLGICYLKGEGVEKSIVNEMIGLEMIRSSARRGCKMAQDFFSANGEDWRK